MIDQVRLPLKSLIYLLGIIFLYSCNGQDPSQQSHAYTNELINESSPYLLQHAHNPVNWHAWNEATLEKAKAEKKMLLISIGYAACHWCHVMEHESFEDTMVARIMNEHFIPIKVDREERPDVDDIYMTACQISSDGSCGWPLNAFAMPDGRPVWAGTYFPKKNWIEILQYFIKLYEEESQKLEEFATGITKGLQQSEQITIGSAEQSFKLSDLEPTTKQFLSTIDTKRGGRVGAPKFPMPNNYEFLLEQSFRTGDEAAKDAVLLTLDNMAKGGIYDHLGGGFARYSTDEKWKVPHFEKMLYDNGQLMSLYAKAFMVTKEARYEEVIRQSLDFIQREMTNQAGGFYSSLDADSEGEEGKFYVWSKQAIDSILNDENISNIFNDFYEVSARGNWEKVNILYHEQSLSQLSEKHGKSLAETQTLLAQARQMLFEARKSRIRPGLDDKVLTSWNALMLTGYVDAFKALGEASYLETALKNGNFLVEHQLQSDFRLDRNYKDGRSSINAFLDDYAFTIQAFIALYEVTFDEAWLKRSQGLADYAISHFLDTTTHLFHYTSKLDPPLIARKKEIADNVIPSSNSAMARALFSLGTFLYQETYQQMARQMMANLGPTILPSEQPSFYSNWLKLYQAIAKPPYEVAIVGPAAANLSRELMQHYLPNSIFLGGTTEGTLELLQDKLVAGETYIYVCQNKVCKFPVQTVEEALKQLK
ncbi:MAG: thioredoxin domain-containing protein [Saprospiraceae bacterium]